MHRAVRDGEDLDAVNSEEEQWTMLMWAAAREEADGEALLRAMISAGADVEKRSKRGSTALMWATRAGGANAVASVRALTQHGGHVAVNKQSKKLRLGKIQEEQTNASLLRLSEQHTESGRPGPDCNGASDTQTATGLHLMELR